MAIFCVTIEMILCGSVKPITKGTNVKNAAPDDKIPTNNKLIPNAIRESIVLFMFFPPVNPDE